MSSSRVDHLLNEFENNENHSPLFAAKPDIMIEEVDENKTFMELDSSNVNFVHISSKNGFDINIENNSDIENLPRVKNGQIGINSDIIQKIQDDKFDKIVEDLDFQSKKNRPEENTEKYLHKDQWQENEKIEKFNSGDQDISVDKVIYEVNKSELPVELPPTENGNNSIIKKKLRDNKQLNIAKIGSVEMPVNKVVKKVDSKLPSQKNGYNEKTENYVEIKPRQQIDIINKKNNDFQLLTKVGDRQENKETIDKQPTPQKLVESIDSQKFTKYARNDTLELKKIPKFDPNVSSFIDVNETAFLEKWPFLKTEFRDAKSGNYYYPYDFLKDLFHFNLRTEYPVIIAPSKCINS